MKKLIGALLVVIVLVTSSSDLLGFSAHSERNASKAKKQADFVFIIDSTGSMSPYIDSAINNVSSFVKYLNNNGVDLRMSIIDFKDITHDEESIIVHSFPGIWSADYDSVVNKLRSISITGGGDDPETPTNALHKIDKGREDVKNFVFLLTDAGYKTSKDDVNVKDMDVTTSLLRQNNISVTVVSKEEFREAYDPLYTLTGGKFININSPDYYKLMLEIADWILQSMLDTDGDGLWDDWEINGVDVDNDGIIDVDLKAMGADPNVPDIFVEVDWMYRPEKQRKVLYFFNKTDKEINYAPSEKQIKPIVEQFKRHGINLHVDAGPNSIMNYDTNQKWNQLSRGNSIAYRDLFNIGNSFEHWNQLALKHFDRSRRNIFRHCFIVNRYQYMSNKNSSGIAEGIPGQFFIVAADKLKDKSVSGTFMHEMGHTLGLKHGNTDHMNYKPNNLSIMNYLYQFSGLMTSASKSINYSDYSLPSINENTINENYGLDPQKATSDHNMGAKWLRAFYNIWKSKDDYHISSVSEIAGKPIDFNVNNKFENDLSMKISEGFVMDRSFIERTENEWERLVYKGGLIGGMGASLEANPLLIFKEPNDPIIEELSIEQAEELGISGNPDDCAIGFVKPDVLYVELSGQQVQVEVENLFPKKTSALLTVRSPILKASYSSSIELPGELGELGRRTVAMAVAEKLKVGTYPINCSLRCANGTTFEYNAYIDVKPMEIATMILGESLSYATEELSQEVTITSSDENVVSLSNGKYLARGIGESLLTLTSSDGSVIAVTMVNVVKSTNPDVPQTGDSFHPMFWLLIAIVSLLVVWLFGSSKRRRS